MAAQYQIGQTDQHFSNRPFDPAFDLIRAVPFSWQANKDQMICDHPDQLARLLRAPANTQTIPSNAISSLFPDDVQARRKAAIDDLLWDGARYILSYQLRTFTGEMIWIEESGERQNGQDELATDIRGILRDVTELRKSRAAVILEDRRDPLTGLLSAQAFKEIYEHERRVGAHRSRLPSIVKLTLANLGDLNETFGYRAGDQSLKYCAEILGQCGLSNSAMCRIDGNQFLALCWMDPKGLSALCSDIKNALFSMPVETIYGELSLVGSIGVHELEAPVILTLMDAVNSFYGSDQVDNSIKNRSRNNQPAKTQKALTRKQVLRLIENQQLLLAFQSIVDSKTLEPQHYECLLRMQSASGDIVSAWPVIQAAEQFDLIGRIDLFVLKQALSILSARPNVHLAVNVSAGTVKNSQASAAYLLELEAEQDLASRLILELTETLALENSARANAFAAKARSLGCRFAVDDFGAGHTSFRHLLNIEADTIKIDGAFVRDIALHEHKQTFVRLIVDLAQTLGVETIAEMVDNPSDAKLLKHLGVDKLQGFLFGFPGALPA